MGQCCASPGEVEDESPQEFEDIRDKTQKDLERDIATRGAAHTGAQKKGADRMSRYATGDSADEPTSGGLVEHSSEGFALSAPAPAEPAPPAPAPPEPNSPSPPSPSPSAAKTSPPRSPKRASPKAYEDPPEAMLDTLPQAEKTPVVVETKDNLSNKGSDAPAAASDALRDRRPMGKRSNLVSSHQPPPALSAREREKREEEEEEEEMRKRKEQMVKMGEVKRAALVDWKDEDFEVNDDEVEIHMDGQDAILEITSNMSENTQTPNKIVPSADPAVVKPEDEGEDHPYPSESYFAANNITPPKVTYYHARNMLTISFQKAAAAELSFSPPTTLHYKAKDTSVHLPLQEGCKSPKVASAAVHLNVSSSDDSLKKSIKNGLAASFATLVGCKEGETAGIEQIIETSLRSCHCVVRFLGPSDDMTSICIARLRELNTVLKERLTSADGGKLEVDSHMFSLRDIPSGDDSVAVRLEKLSAVRWPALIQADAESTQGRRMSQTHAWITPEDVSDDEDEEEDEDDNDYQ